MLRDRRIDLVQPEARRPPLAQLLQVRPMLKQEIRHPNAARSGKGWHWPRATDPVKHGAQFRGLSEQVRHGVDVIGCDVLFPCVEWIHSVTRVTKLHGKAIFEIADHRSVRFESLKSE